jgi:hypothetical protein
MLGQEITLLAGQINAANHRLLKLIARFDRRKAWSGGGTVRSCAHWLNWKCGIVLGAAREKVVGKYRSGQAAADDSVEREQDNTRRLVYCQDSDGMWVIHARLTPEAGALVVKAIQAIATPVQTEKQEQLQLDRQDSPKDVSAETFSDAVQKEEPSPFQELLEHTRADALAGMAEHFLATTDRNPQLKGLKGSERCQVVLHVDINTLRQHRQAPGPCP